MKSAACSIFIAVVLAATAAASQTTAQSTLTVAQIKKAIVAASIAAYPGNCPCPYNVDRGGRRCGRRSAYDRPGGASPICFESDVSASMIEAYRRRADK